jgi:glycosyltransferase involved in cell wall biosynthesis
LNLSIEVPVFKGDFLRPCIDSVLAQTSHDWTLSLLWDGGDERSRLILEQLERERHPRIRIYFDENRGIAGARRFLTDHSAGEYILPLDDDDMLPPRATERFLRVATERPWASLIRGRRLFIDEGGAFVQEEQWFPFGPRTYDRGMVTDVFNQAQPYVIRRSAYDRTRGWNGFPDFHGAGEDCDIFLQLEEVAHFELIDEVLYHYRLHGARASHALTSSAAFEMWRRLCDAAITRIGLPLRRVNAAPPFVYERLPRSVPTVPDIDFVTYGTEGIAAAGLRRCGVADDAIHETRGLSAATWRMAGFRATERQLVCFVNHDVAIQSRDALEELVRELGIFDADMVVPRLCSVEGGGNDGEFPAWPAGQILLLRREVIAATGGFDEDYVAAPLQPADLWAQARRRGFRCVEIALEGVTARGAYQGWTHAAVDALKTKWRTHPDMLEPAALPLERLDVEIA